MYVYMFREETWFFFLLHSQKTKNVCVFWINRYILIVSASAKVSTGTWCVTMQFNSVLASSPFSSGNGNSSSSTCLFWYSCFVHIYIYIYIYICLCVCMYVCMYVCVCNWVFEYVWMYQTWFCYVFLCTVCNSANGMDRLQ